MIYEGYEKQMLTKLEQLNGYYARTAYKKLFSIEDVQALQTQEHLRSVPQDGWAPFPAGTKWGGEWQNLWLKGRVTVPQAAAGQNVYVLPHTGGWETLYFVDGKPKGIFNSVNDFIGGMHSAQLLFADAKPGDSAEVALECFAGLFRPGNHPYDTYGPAAPAANPDDYFHTYEGIDICLRDEEIWGFVYDLKAALQLARGLPAESPLRNQARRTLQAVFPVVLQYPAGHSDEELHETARQARQLLRPLLAHGDAAATPRIGLIGHSHMDTAWIWPEEETVRKCARTYANVLSLMEQYPEYRFVQSTVLHLDWMREYYPDIYEGIRARAAEGRYEPNGGMWVECDGNLPSGEAIIRQFLIGQWYLRDNLHYTADTLWLPDTFGYSAALPQIMQGCCIPYFCTTKLSWNELNDFPMDTFVWRGLDGTPVLTHFNLIHCFPDAGTILNAAKGVKNPEVCDAKLISFGYGDGGGGPTPGMLEDARRACGLPELPAAGYTSVSGFMNSLAQTADRLPVYRGELYLEKHRGSLTQVHDIKRGNRKAEFALHDLDVLNVLAGAPACGRTTDLYKLLLKNQFHDILSGTSLEMVHARAKRELAEVAAGALSAAKEYAAGLTDGDGAWVTAFNTLSFPRDDLLRLEGVAGSAEGCECQRVRDLCGRELLEVRHGGIPAFSAVSLRLSDAPPAAADSPFRYDGQRLTTPFAQLHFTEDGRIDSWVDTRCARELCREGAQPLNTFYLAENLPLDWDAHDIDYDIQLKLRPHVRLLSRETAADGPLEFRLRSRYAIGRDSVLEQDMIFYAHTARVDFHTVIDWKEKRTILKAGFDVDVFAPYIKNEVQFGYLERPTTRNDSVEAAKFELCNHKWSDLSESRFGVAVLNDCKYGLSVQDSDIRLTLHLGGCHPDTTGDAGVHEMAYSLLPHLGGMDTAGVIRPAYMLNDAPLIVSGRLLRPAGPLVTVSADNVICETVKPAARQEGAFVLRLYEAERCQTDCLVTLPADVTRVRRANMLEDPGETLPISGGAVNVRLRPFEICTLLCERG